jgi:hypothetical protein
MKITVSRGIEIGAGRDKLARKTTRLFRGGGFEIMTGSFRSK